MLIIQRVPWLLVPFNPYWCRLPILADSRRFEQVVWDRAFIQSPVSGYSWCHLCSSHLREAPPECVSLLHFVIDVTASPAQQWGCANGISFHLLFMYINSNSWIAGHWCLFSPVMFPNSLFLPIASSIILVFNCNSTSISPLSGWRHLSPRSWGVFAQIWMISSCFLQNLISLNLKSRKYLPEHKTGPF